jgi:phosphoribosyl 1,2-cyclic phosphodiesterase
MASVHYDRPGDRLKLWIQRQALRYNAAMEVISLQSGSNGNCYFVCAGDARFLIDAGISAQAVRQRLAPLGYATSAIQAILISHEHHDHSRSMGVFQRQFRAPLFVTRQTLAATPHASRPDRSADVRYFESGQTIQLGDVQIHTIPTPHDSVDGVAFVIEHRDRRLGILSDLGHVFDGLREVLLSLDAVIIESNYDRQMLAEGPYPEHLKRRIRGSGGHLSNDESAELVSKASMFQRLRWACLCHLSAENNSPQRALETHRQWVGRSLPLHVAGRDGASAPLSV